MKNKLDIMYLSGVISENQYHEASGSDGLKHYMFFANLKNIKEKVEEILKADPHLIDQALSDGHDWASDHISTSRDDVEEVHNWVMSRIVK
jgi:uncharacterized protein YktB (UPF0637 family)